MSKELVVFDGDQIRRVWNKKEGQWYFSVIDVVKVLTDSINSTDYLKKMRKRDLELSSFIGTNCPQVEMRGQHGKMRLTLAGTTEKIFRIIQSIPSKKAEPFKLWLAKVGHERIQEIADPEKSLNRARTNWQKLGRSDKWIQQRMMGQEIRNKLTDYWQNHEITKEQEFAILTNIIHSEWSELTVNQHKKIKGLKQHNLRDHMTDAELVFTALAELSTRQIAETDQAIGMEDNVKAGVRGGRLAKRARLELEQNTGKKVVSSSNYLSPQNKQDKLN